MAIRIFVSLVILLSPGGGFAQGSQPSASPSARATIGTVTAVNGNTITVKTDSGTETQVSIPESARIVKTAPGQKDLKGATVIRLQDVQVGDRALVRGAPGEGGNAITASSLIVMKQGDVAGRQQQEIQDWQRRGTGGIVRSIDVSLGTITVGTTPNQTTTIQTGPDTQFLRYAPDSVKFGDARKSTIAEIKSGDQLRARGNRSADGQLTAEAVISGSFRNIAGTVNSIDAAANTITLIDLIAKSLAVVKITPDTQMRKIPPQMAQRIAMFLRQPAGAGSASDQSSNPQPTGMQPMRAGGGGAHGGPGGQSGPPDFQRMIRAMPAATIADLQKGDAVMIVTTEGAPGQQVTALTLLSGVEPIFTAAPTQTTAASLLSGWSVGGGGEGEAQ